jgi:hypothetical protein
LGEAVRRHPEHPQNHIFSAQALWEIEGEDAKEEVQKHLEEGLRLLDQTQWLTAKDRWIKDLQEVAEDADIVLIDHIEAE